MNLLTNFTALALAIATCQGAPFTRSGWYALTDTTGTAAIQTNLIGIYGLAKTANLSRVYAWTFSGFISGVLSNVPPAKPEVTANWLAYALLVGQTNGIQTALHWSLFGSKWPDWCPETFLHPEWTEIGSDTLPHPGGSICLGRDEVRQAELDLILATVDNYPGLVGVHLDEPYLLGSPTGDTAYCYCANCLSYLAAHPTVTRPQFYQNSCSNFVKTLRTALNARGKFLEANGSYGMAGFSDNKDRGADFTLWCNNNWIDSYCPQAYFQTVTSWTNAILSTTPLIGGKPLLAGICVHTDALTNTTTAILNQVNASYSVANGFALFRVDDLITNQARLIGAGPSLLRVTNLTVRNP